MSHPVADMDDASAGSRRPLAKGAAWLALACAGPDRGGVDGLRGGLDAHPRHPDLQQRLRLRPDPDGAAARPRAWAASSRRAGCGGRATPGGGWPCVRGCSPASSSPACPSIKPLPNGWNAAATAIRVAAVFLGEAALTAAAVFLPAVCMGLSLPLLVAAVASERERFGAALGRLYAVNTLGCVVGPFLAGFVLIPRLGIQTTMGLVVAASVLVGLVAWLRAPRPGFAWRCRNRRSRPARRRCPPGSWLPAGGFTKSPVNSAGTTPLLRRGRQRHRHRRGGAEPDAPHHGGRPARGRHVRRPASSTRRCWPTCRCCCTPPRAAP